MSGRGHGIGTGRGERMGVLEVVMVKGKGAGQWCVGAFSPLYFAPVKSLDGGHCLCMQRMQCCMLCVPMHY